MRAYHNDPKIKEKYLGRVKAHRAADQLIKGQYWENGKGCAVGCTIHSSNHTAYETELGIPRKLAKIEDGIFEGLPNGKSLDWPVQFLDSIPVGANLARVVDEFLLWILVDKKDGVIRFARTDKIKKAIRNVGDLYRRRLAGEEPSEKECRAYAAAAYAAAYAADAAAYAAAYAAYAAARGKDRIRQAEKLVELLCAAPIGE